MRSRRLAANVRFLEVDTCNFRQLKSCKEGKIGLAIRVGIYRREQGEKVEEIVLKGRGGDLPERLAVHERKGRAARRKGESALRSERMGVRYSMRVRRCTMDARVDCSWHAKGFDAGMPTPPCEDGHTQTAVLPNSGCTNAQCDPGAGRAGDREKESRREGREAGKKGRRGATGGSLTVGSSCAYVRRD